MGIEQEQTNRTSTSSTSSTSSSEASENDNTPKQEKSKEIKCEDHLQKVSENSDQSNNKELLGSVIVQNCPGVRTSARVIQKMKQDSVRCTSPPLNDKKDLQKTPNQSRTASSSLTSSPAVRHTWTNLEKNLFFDALNEYGKDFDAICNFINSKIKKSSSDQSTKTKEQIRHSYYQTFHKLLKYVKFSDEVRKPVQELYTLINYGEMRRRLAFVTEKNLMKIRQLVYKGYVTVRNKGKSIRIKTPSCKALRNLNQLEGWLEDIKLPSRVEVCLRPATMEAWGRVQNIAQNPVVRTVVPLQKRLISIIKTFQYKWRSQDTKMNETALKLFGTSSSSSSMMTNESLIKCDNKIDSDQNFHNDEPLICLIPQKDAIINRPLVSITQYLSSFNICLNSYEERMGIKLRGETLLSQDRSHNSKRQRTDSGCEKKNSPDNKKYRTNTDNVMTTTTSVATTSTATTSRSTIDMTPLDKCFSDISDNYSSINSKDYKDESDDLDLMCGIESDLIGGELYDERQASIYDCIDIINGNSNNKNDKIDDGIMSNNSVNNNGNGNISKLCLSSSQSDVLNKTKKYNKKKDKDLLSSKKDINNLKPLINDDTLKRIRKGWTMLNASDITIGDLYIVFGHNTKLMFEYYWLNDKKIEFDINVPYNSTNKNDTVNLVIGQNNSNKNDIINKFNQHQNLLSNKLKHLLLIANLNERIKRKQCACGHICGMRTKQPENNEVATKSFVSNVTYSSASNTTDVNVFRQPVLPLRRTLAVQSFTQVPNGRVKQSRFLRTGKIGSRQIVVQRLLPIQPGVNQSFDVVTPQLEICTVQDEQSTVSTSTTAAINRRDRDFENTQESLLSDGISIITTTTTTPTIEKDENTTISNDVNRIQNQTTIINNGKDFINDIFTSPSPSSSSSHNDSEILKESTSNGNDLITRMISTTSSNNELDPVLNPLLDISLSSPLPINSLDENTNDTITNIPPLRETSSGDSSKWLDENIGDFSLTSFLGHLDEINNREVDNANISVISESSVDYVSKFAEIASMQNEERDL